MQAIYNEKKLTVIDSQIKMSAWLEDPRLRLLNSFSSRPYDFYNSTGGWQLEKSRLSTDRSQCKFRKTAFDLRSTAVVAAARTPLSKKNNIFFCCCDCATRQLKADTKAADSNCCEIFLNKIDRHINIRSIRSL